MSATFRLIAVLACGPLLAAQGERAVSESSRAAIEKAILEVSAQMTRAAEQGDIDRLFSFMLDTSKGSVVQNGNLLLTRQQALEQVKNNFRGIGKIEYRWKQQHVTVISPTVALLVAEGESLVTTSQGDSFTAPFVQSVVFVASGGEWKALHAHQSSPQRR